MLALSHSPAHQPRLAACPVAPPTAPPSKPAGHGMELQLHMASEPRVLSQPTPSSTIIRMLSCFQYDPALQGSDRMFFGRGFLFAWGLVR